MSMLVRTVKSSYESLIWQCIEGISCDVVRLFVVTALRTKRLPEGLEVNGSGQRFEQQSEYMEQECQPVGRNVQPSA